MTKFREKIESSLIPSFLSLVTVDMCAEVVGDRTQPRPSGSFSLFGNGMELKKVLELQPIIKIKKSPKDEVGLEPHARFPCDERGVVLTK